MGNQHMIPKITKPKWLTLNLCLGGVLSRLLPHCLCGLHAQGKSMSRKVRLYKCSCTGVVFQDRAMSSLLILQVLTLKK